MRHFRIAVLPPDPATLDRFIVGCCRIVLPSFRCKAIDSRLATARIATIVFCVNNFRAELLPFRKIPMLDVTVAESRPLANLPVKRFLPRDACFPRTRPVLATSVCAKSTVQRLITFTFRWTRTEKGTLAAESSYEHRKSHAEEGREDRSTARNSSRRNHSVFALQPP